MAQKVIKKAGVKREKGYIYFIDKNGNIARSKRGKKGQEVVKKTAVKKEKGYLYFLNKQGHISRAKMKNK